MLSVGAASTMITPRLGIELAGYGPDFARRSRGVKDGLSAQALVLRGGSTEAALISDGPLRRFPRFRGCIAPSNLRGYGHPGTDRTRIGLPRAYRAHGRRHARGTTRSDYLDHLVERLTDLTGTASRRLTPVAVQTMCARYPAFLQPRPRGARDRTDPELTVTAFHRRDGPPGFEALALSFACHPVTLGPIDEVSADFPGEVRRHLLDRFPDGSVLHFSGACGDIDPSVNEAAWGSGTMDDVRHMGALLAQAAAAALGQGARDIPGDDCRLPARTTVAVELPYDLPSIEEVEQSIAGLEAGLPSGDSSSDRPFGNVNERAVPAAVLAGPLPRSPGGLAGTRPASGETIEVQSISLCPVLRFIGIPAEMYAASGLHIKGEGEGRTRFRICYANGLVGYLAPREEYERGSYTTTLAAAVNRRPPFAVGTAEQVERAIAHLTAGPT